MFKKAVLAVVTRSSSSRIVPTPAPAQHGGPPSVLSVREQARLSSYRITAKRLDTLLPRMMRETGFDMWIVSCNEDNLDPIFETMIPYENWNPITQILVFFDQGPAKGVERLNVSRTDTQGLFKNAWDAAAFDAKKGEGQWEALGRVVRERDPKRIGLNEGEVQWAAGGADLGPEEEDRRGRRPEVRRPPPVRRAAGDALGGNAHRRRGRGHGAGRGPVAVDHRRHVLGQGDHGRPDDGRRPALVLLAARRRPRPQGVLLSLRLDPRPVAEGRREVGQGRQDHPAGRPPPLRRRDQVHALEQRPPGDGLRPPARRDGRAGDVQEAHGRGQPSPGRLLRRVQDRAHRERAPREHPQEGPRARHPRPARLLALARLFPPRARARSSACPGSRSTTSAAATSSSSP